MILAWKQEYSLSVLTHSITCWCCLFSVVACIAFCLWLKMCEQIIGWKSGLRILESVGSGSVTACYCCIGQLVTHQSSTSRNQTKCHIWFRIYTFVKTNNNLKAERILPLFYLPQSTDKTRSLRESQLLLSVSTAIYHIIRKVYMEMGMVYHNHRHLLHRVQVHYKTMIKTVKS